MKPMYASASYKPSFNINFSHTRQTNKQQNLKPFQFKLLTKPFCSSWGHSKSNGVYDLNKATWDVTKNNKPSDKITKMKFGDPFAVGSKHQTNFGYVYSAGGIPCRIEHGNVRMKLKWDIPPENLEYDPTLIICFEGLLETKHPYNFAAKQCIKELLLAKGAAEKILPLLGRLINPLRNALASPRPEIFVEAMEIAQQISMLVRDQLNQYLHFFLQMVNKRSFNLKYKEQVFDLLRVFESNGGEEALKIIKMKIPTYISTI